MGKVKDILQTVYAKHVVDVRERNRFNPQFVVIEVDPEGQAQLVEKMPTLESRITAEMARDMVRRRKRSG